MLNGYEVSDEDYNFQVPLSIIWMHFSPIRYYVPSSLHQWITWAVGEVLGHQLGEATVSDRVIPQSKQTEWGQCIMTLCTHLLTCKHLQATTFSHTSLSHKVTHFSLQASVIWHIYMEMHENTNCWHFDSSWCYIQTIRVENRSVKWATWYPKGKQVRITISMFHTDNKLLVIAVVHWVQSP